MEKREKKAICICLRERDTRRLNGGYIGVYPAAREMQRFLGAYLKLNKEVQNVVRNLLWSRNGETERLKEVLSRVDKITDEMLVLAKELRGGKNDISS